MKKIAFTPTVAKRLIDRAKKNFREHPFSPQEWVDVFDSLEISVAINHSIAYYPSAYAMSYIFDENSADEYKLDKNKSSYNVDDDLYWLCLEFKAEIVCQADSSSLFNLVAHEVAHSLDYVIRGKMQDPNEAHDEFFQVLVKMMGATDTIRLPHRSGIVGRIKKSIESFGGVKVAH